MRKWNGVREEKQVFLCDEIKTGCGQKLSESNMPKMGTPTESRRKVVDESHLILETETRKYLYLLFVRRKILNFD